MMFWRWILYGLALWLLLAGIWDHDWRLIIASVAVWAIYPLISAPVEKVRLPDCLGCQRHRVIPGCPRHDPQARRAA